MRRSSRRSSRSTPRSKRVAGGAGTARGSGGMASKLAAAKIAAWSGVRVVIAAAAADRVVVDALDGNPVGTRSRRGRSGSRAASSGSRSRRARRAASSSTPAPRNALVNNGKSLLAAGVRETVGGFDADAAVEIVDDHGAVFAKGLSRYSSPRSSAPSRAAAPPISPRACPTKSSTATTSSCSRSVTAMAVRDSRIVVTGANGRRRLPDRAVALTAPGDRRTRVLRDLPAAPGRTTRLVCAQPASRPSRRDLASAPSSTICRTSTTCFHRVSCVRTRRDQGLALRVRGERGGVGSLGRALRRDVAASSTARPAPRTRIEGSGRSARTIHPARISATTASRRSRASRRRRSRSAPVRDAGRDHPHLLDVRPEGGAPADRFALGADRGEPVPLHPDQPNRYNPISEDDYVEHGVPRAGSRRRARRSSSLRRLRDGERRGVLHRTSTSSSGCSRSSSSTIAAAGRCGPTRRACTSSSAAGACCGATASAASCRRRARAARTRTPAPISQT